MGSLSDRCHAGATESAQGEMLGAARDAFQFHSDSIETGAQKLLICPGFERNPSS